MKKFKKQTSDQLHIFMKKKTLVILVKCQGVKLTFLSDSHLAPKFFKVVANSKRWRLVIDRDACATFWKQTKRGSLPWIYLCKFMMKRCSGQFGN